MDTPRAATFDVLVRTGNKPHNLIGEGGDWAPLVIGKAFGPSVTGEIEVQLGAAPVDPTVWAAANGTLLLRPIPRMR